MGNRYGEFFPACRQVARVLRTRVIGIMMPVALTLAGCSTDRDPADLYAPDDVGRLVVDAVLMVGRPFPTIVLTRAMRPDVAFDWDAAAESGAAVVVTDRDRGINIRYYETSEHRGFYGTRSAEIVRAETTYDLRILTTSGETVTASTLTPAHFTVESWLLLDGDGQTVRRRLKTFEELGDSVYYAPENQLVYSDGLLEARFRRPDTPAFQLGLSSLDLGSDFVIDPSFFEEDDFADLERDVTSPALEALDGRIALPWFAVYFEGRHTLRLLSLDNNTFDLIRSTPDDEGGLGFGGNIGDSFQRPIFHVNGGIGLFGSAAADSVGFYVLPRP